MGLEVEKDQLVIHVSLAGSAGARGPISKMASLSIYLGVHVLGLCLFIYMAFLPPGPLLHVAWASLRMVVSKPLLFLQGSWFPRGRKQKLPGHFRITPRIGTGHFYHFALVEQLQALSRLKRKRGKLRLWRGR